MSSISVASPSTLSLYASAQISVCLSLLLSLQCASLHFLTPTNPKARFSFSYFIRPSIHLPIWEPNWRAVSACNFYHDHTFVFVPVMKDCSSPWPHLPECFCGQKCIAPVCRDLVLRKRQNLCVWSERKRERETFLPLLSGSYSLVWMVGIAVSLNRDSHTHSWAQEYLPPPPRL